MPLNFTAAHSSRTSQAKYRNPLQRRSSSTPLQENPRKKAKKRPTEDDDENESLFDSRLDDKGLVHHLAQDLSLRDVAQQLQYIQNHMFDEIPQRAGLNSTRIAEVLNFRRMLPPIVTVAHIHALSRSHTAAEREIVELIRKGVVRRVRIPGRGLGSSTVGECLVLTESWTKSIQGADGLDEAIKQKYIDTLHRNPDVMSVSASSFEPEDASQLLQAGYLTAGAQMAHGGSSTGPSLGSLSSLSTAGSRAAAGTVAAVGGEGAIHDAGGGGSSLNASSTKRIDEYHFSLPSIGPYLRLLESSRNHLIDLLSKSKFKEAPQSLLKERWDGGVSPTDPEAHRTSRTKGLQAVVLPAKTRKWKMYYGLRFQWVLEECLGTGAIEVFETGSVGLGVRLP